jgi:hypothetical protein
VSFFLALTFGCFLLQTSSPIKALAAPAETAVLTYKANIERTGNYAHEALLNKNNVNASQFGKRVSYPVDGQVYAQPLYMPNLNINGATHNTVFVATEHDSVYAFDADQTNVASPLWHTSFLTNGATSVPFTTVQCHDMIPESGITGTPAIDSQTNTMYVVSYTLENGNEVYRLHALNVTNGTEKSGSPTVIQASVSGNGAGSVNGRVAFNPLRQRQRSALLLANGQIYISFGSFCDRSPYHGWILGYTYNGSSFQQASVYNDTPNGSGGGIWAGLSADSSGNIYFASGNGDFDLNAGGANASDAFGRLNAQLQLQDYFVPFNEECLQRYDIDLGSGAPLVLPPLNEIIGGGKEGRVYVVATHNMGRFTEYPNLDCNTARNYTHIDNVRQEFAPDVIKRVYGIPAYWNSGSGQFVYFSGADNHAKAYRLNNGLLSANATSQTRETFGFPGANPAISSNGTAADTGMVWLIDPRGVLRAYDATNLDRELYNSSQNPGRDGLDNYVKFTTPTIANGEVFVGTASTLTIFGHLPG